MLNQLSLYPFLLGAGEDTTAANSVQTLLAISHAIEDTVEYHRLQGVFYAGFQRFSAFLPQARRFRRLAACAEVLVFGVPDIPAPAIPGITFVPLQDHMPLAREWFLVFEHPNFQVALLTQLAGKGSTERVLGLDFRRERKYIGGVTLLPSIVSRARHSIDEALQRSPVVVQPAGQAMLSDPVKFYNRSVVRYLEQRSQQIIQLYTVLAERTRKIERLTALLQKTNQELELKVQARTAELAKANQQLQELDHLKSSFIGVISHELRTPFTGILFSLQLLESDGLEALNPEQQQMFAQLSAGVQSAYAMIENLVKYATFVRKQGVLRKTSVNVQRFLETCVLVVRSQAEHKGLSLETSLSPDLCPVTCDEERLSDAIHELLDNAIKFTPAGGKITLRGWVAENALHISVEDTGPGIPPEILPALWQSFAQMADPLRRGREGLGLGLALVEYIVKAHKGQVWAQSQVGKGTTFGFHIPIT